MTLTETLAWGLGLLAFARLVLAPLGDHITRRHASRGNWSKDADVPLWAWPAGIAFALFATCDLDFLAWLLHVALARN
ncbi:hypothetical protein D3C87_1901720 [compost metagenome]